MMDGFLLLVNIFIILDLPAALHVVSREILPPTWKSASEALGIAVLPPRGTPTKDRARKIYLQRYVSHPCSPQGHFLPSPVQHQSAKIDQKGWLKVNLIKEANTR